MIASPLAPPLRIALVAVQGEVVGGLALVMAGEAVFAKDGPNVLFVGDLRAIGRGGRARREQEER